MALFCVTRKFATTSQGRTDREKSVKKYLYLKCQRPFWGRAAVTTIHGFPQLVQKTAGHVTTVVFHNHTHSQIQITFRPAAMV